MSEQTPRPASSPVRTSTKSFQPGERRTHAAQPAHTDMPTQQQPAQHQPAPSSPQPAAVPPPASRKSSQQGEQTGGRAAAASQQSAHPGSPRRSTTSSAAESKPDTGPRRVRLAISRVDPWSVMKLSFLLSIAIGIGIVVATAVVWGVLNSMGVFAQIQSLIEEIGAMAQFGELLGYLEFSRVISVATVVAIVDVVLLTALATLGAFVYNLVAAMVGGLHLTLTDD